MAIELDNLKLSKEELEFFKQQLEMSDEAEIKDHIVKVGTRAHEVRAAVTCSSPVVSHAEQEKWFPPPDIPLRLHLCIPFCQVRVPIALLDLTDNKT